MKKQILLSVMILVAISMRAQYKLDTLHYAGDSKYFIDIVYLGDGFTEEHFPGRCKLQPLYSSITLRDIFAVCLSKKQIDL